LKPGGVLIVTTPNLLHLEGRIITLLTGHAFRNRVIVVESAGSWGKRGAETRGTVDTYFGHVSVVNALQLRFYLTHAGLEVVEVRSTRCGWQRVLLAPLMVPFIWFATRNILRKKRSRIPRELQRQILGAPVLFGRKLIMVARKPAV